MNSELQSIINDIIMTSFEPKWDIFYVYTSTYQHTWSFKVKLHKEGLHKESIEVYDRKRDRTRYYPPCKVFIECLIFLKQ